MLDVGFPASATGGDEGRTAMHAAAYAGSANVIRLLLERGADAAGLLRKLSVPRGRFLFPKPLSLLLKTGGATGKAGARPGAGCPVILPGMATVIKTVSFDAADALVLATFWAGALGSDVDEDSTSGKAFVEAAGWGGPNIWFNRVPEPKTAKNRMHLDLRAPGGVAEEVARLERLGATVLVRHEHHVIMADPEGNEFCVEPGPGRGPA
jgi:hypothetical protein